MFKKEPKCFFAQTPIAKNIKYLNWVMPEKRIKPAKPNPLPILSIRIA